MLFGSRGRRRSDCYSVGLTRRSRHCVGSPRQTARVSRNLSLDRPLGSIPGPAKAAAKLENAVDLLWIATKAYQLDEALQSVRCVPRCVVPLLNGVDHVEVLRRPFGRNRVVRGTIAVEAENIAPGNFVQRSSFANLNLSAAGESLLTDTVAESIGLGFSCNFIANEQTLL
jgi:2-dehydropantoate 2-reductase